MEKIYLITNEFNGMVWANKTKEGAHERVRNEIELLKSIKGNFKIISKDEKDTFTTILAKLNGKIGFITIRESRLFD